MEHSRTTKGKTLLGLILAGITAQASASPLLSNINTQTSLAPTIATHTATVIAQPGTWENQGCTTTNNMKPWELSTKMSQENYDEWVNTKFTSCDINKYNSKDKDNLFTMLNVTKSEEFNCLKLSISIDTHTVLDGQGKIIWGTDDSTIIKFAPQSCKVDTSSLPQTSLG